MTHPNKVHSVLSVFLFHHKYKRKSKLFCTMLCNISNVNLYILLMKISTIPIFKEKIVKILMETLEGYIILFHTYFKIFFVNGKLNFIYLSIYTK